MASDPGASGDHSSNGAMTFFAFLLQRPHDKEPWPVIWASREAAEAEEFRVSEVAEVIFDEVVA